MVDKFHNNFWIRVYKAVMVMIARKQETSSLVRLKKSSAVDSAENRAITFLDAKQNLAS